MGRFGRKLRKAHTVAPRDLPAMVAELRRRMQDERDLSRVVGYFDERLVTNDVFMVGNRTRLRLAQRSSDDAAGTPTAVTESAAS